MVSAVVVAYGASPVLARCVDALLASEGVDVEVVVVDNGVTNGALAGLPLDRRVRQVASPGNLGFGGGCNLGAAHATGEVLAFVNPDSLADPSALRALSDALRDPEVGIATGQIRLLDAPHLVNSAGGAVHFVGIGWAVGYRQPAERHAAGRDVAAASGAGMGMRAATFRALGGFTEELFLYHEDAELSLRCWMDGMRVTYVPAARFLHDYEFGRHPSKLYYLERNRLVLVLTCYERRTLWLLAPALVAFEAGIFVVALLQGWAGAKLRGWAWLVRRRRWLAGQRQRVQSSRRVGDGSFAGLLASEFDAQQVAMPAALRVFDRALCRYWRLVRRCLNGHGAAPGSEGGSTAQRSRPSR